jgi:transposase
MKKVQYFIGIDLHKTVLQVCVLNKAGEIDEEFRQRLDETDAETEVLQRLRRWKANGQYVVEAQGLNRWFVNACQAVGMRILVANPTTLNLKRSGKKTDRRDAYELARRLWLGDIEKHARTYYPADEEYGKRKVLRVRHKCVALRQQVINQLRGVLGAYRIPAPQTVLYTTPSLAKLERVERPTPELTFWVQTLVTVLKALQQAIIPLTRQITQCAEAPRVATLQEQLPSVGPQTALTLDVELGDLTRFGSAKQLCSYAGLVPRVTDSADRQNHGRLTKRGNAEVRWILGQWALRLLASNPQVQAWATARARRLHKNKVRVALARRLLVGIFVSPHKGEPFSLQRCLAT